MVWKCSALQIYTVVPHQSDPLPEFTVPQPANKSEVQKLLSKVLSGTHRPYYGYLHVFHLLSPGCKIAAFTRNINTDLHMCWYHWIFFLECFTRTNTYLTKPSQKSNLTLREISNCNIIEDWGTSFYNNCNNCNPEWIRS